MMKHFFNDGFNHSMHERRLVYFADHEKPADAAKPEEVKDEEFKKAFNEMLNQRGSKESVQKMLLEEFRTNGTGDSFKKAQQIRDRLSNLPSLSTKAHGEVKEILDRIPNDTKSLVKFAVEHQLFTADELWAAGMEAGAKKIDTTPYSQRGYERGKTKGTPTAAPVQLEAGPVAAPVPTYMPRRAGSHYDRATRMMVHTDADGNVRMERLEDIRARLDAQHAEIAYRNQMQRNQNIANGRLVQNWRSDPVSTEHRLNTERTAAQFGITPDQMYKPVTGTDANFARHVKRGVRGGNPVFMNESGNYAYIDNDIPRNRIDPKTGMMVDQRGAYNEYMAANNPAEVLGMPNAQILSDAATPQEQLFNDARGIYGKRANRAPAGNITPFNKIDTNTPESQKQITDFYQNENIQRLQSAEFDDLKMHKNPAVRKAYADITSAFNNGIMKRGKVEYADTALARTRMENLRRNAEMMTNNDNLKGNKLAERFFPVHGFQGDAPVIVTFESEFKGRKEKHQINIRDPRSWGDGIYGAKGSADFAAEAGIHVIQEKFADGRIRGMTLEFSKPGKFQISGPKNGSGRGGWTNETVVVKDPNPYEGAPAILPEAPITNSKEELPVPPEPQPDPEAAKNIPKNMKPVPEDTSHIVPAPLPELNPSTTPNAPTPSVKPSVKPSPANEKPGKQPDAPKTTPTQKPVTPKVEATPTKPAPTPEKEEPYVSPFSTVEEPTVIPVKPKGGTSKMPEKPAEKVLEEVDTGGGLQFLEDLSAPAPTPNTVAPAAEVPASEVPAEKKITRRRKSSSKKTVDEDMNPADALDALKTGSDKTAEDSDAVSAVDDVQAYPADALDALSVAPVLTVEQKQMLAEGADNQAYEDFLVEGWNKSEAALKPVLDTLLNLARKTSHSPSAAEKHADAASERASLRKHADMWLDSNLKFVFLGRVQYLNTLINEEQTLAEIEKEFREYIES